MSNDIWGLIATERRRLADELEGLSQQQWKTQSQCAAWTVKEVGVHLVTPFETSKPKFLFTLLKNRRNFENTILELTAKANSKTSVEDVIMKLREYAEHRWAPPGRGAEIPLSEIVVHGQDIRRVLGMTTTIPTATVDLALEGIDDAEVRADYSARIGLPVGPGR